MEEINERDREIEEDAEHLEELESVVEGLEDMSERDIEIEERRFHDYSTAESREEKQQRLPLFDQQVAELSRDWDKLRRNFYAFERRANRIIRRRGLNRKEQTKLSSLKEEFNYITKTIERLNDKGRKSDRYFQQYTLGVFGKYNMKRDVSGDFTWRDYNNFERRLKRLCNWKEMISKEIEDLKGVYNDDDYD